MIRTPTLHNEMTITPGSFFLNCSYKPCYIFSSVYTLSAKIQTDLQHYVHAHQHSIFPFQATAQKTHLGKCRNIRTFSPLFIVDNRTHVFGHSPVPQAYCPLFNLSRRVPLDVCMSRIESLKFPTGKVNTFTCMTIITYLHACGTSFCRGVRGESFSNCYMIAAGELREQPETRHAEQTP